MSSQKWTVSQAAQILGVSEKTVYRHIKSGKLKARIEGAPPTAHWMVDPVVKKGQLSGQSGGQPSGQGDGQDRLVTSSQESTTVIEILREQLREKDRQIAELHVLLRASQGQINTLLPAPREEEQPPVRKKHRWWPF